MNVLPFALYLFAVFIIGVLVYSRDVWITLQQINPYVLGGLGCALSISMSIFGASWGIFTAGSSIAGASVQAPHIRSKNLISIIFCEAVAIYGIIMAIIQTSKMEHHDDIFQMHPTGLSFSHQTIVSGYLIFCSGLTIGFGTLACGISIGVLGSACAIGDAAKSSLFIKFLIMEIFASAFGIFALIIAILQVQAAKF
ncbi:UDP-glucose 6-dehydrogenase-like protein [Perkinsela sp. CCAP 1560/4]|nr:UDP-glucose 6-dehydrogenase-like protein [Perkinsela sp. CCAP 1560/4]|eukprot:KNH09568.1 UDP-glucose 6-dehydrogenase-like protein [Perkinsela sp. CCAP 1560/4]